MDKFTLDRKAKSGISVTAEPGVVGGAEIVHVAAGHFTCKVRSVGSGSVKIFDCVSDDDSGEEIADEALSDTTYLNVPEWDGTHLRFVFTTSGSLDVKIVSH